MAGEIQFHFENKSMPDFFDQEKIRHWLLDLILSFGKDLDYINYIFCSDDYLLEINKTYLNHDYYTDIITFPYNQDDRIESDIFISLDRVIDNSSDLNVLYRDELHRVMAHGVLHLCGLTDKSKEEASIMRKAEDEALKLIDF